MKSSELSNVDRIVLALGHAGRNSLSYIDDDRNADRPFTLHTYRAYGYTADRPVVVVQHGALRNGDEYRDFWIPFADKHQLLIVAPTFPHAVWPGVESYHNGRVFSAGGNPRHIDGWAYALVASVIRDLVTAEVTDGQNVYLFGHAAGAQFVHRLMSSQAHTPFKAVTVANADHYTLPTFEHAFPEGMAQVGLSENHLAALLRYPMTILVGDQNTATDDPDLPSEPAALRQGAHRYARAHHYFESGRAAAQARNIPFAWTLQAVPGTGHNGHAMSTVCARLWFENRLPGAEELAPLATQFIA